MDHTYAVIMAGGSGTRLWPVSRRSHPKQLISLVEDQSLFQSTLMRLEGLLPTERILIATVIEQAKDLQEQAPKLPKENFLLEPSPRGTASVIGLAAAVLQKRDPLAVMAVLPSDHYIRNRDLFYKLVRVGVDVAQKEYLVTLGITPTYPATVYGYIQRGDKLAERFGHPAHHVKRFKEKPNDEQARQMLASKDHYWNSGMFIWRTDTILKEIARQMPDLSSALIQIAAVWGKKKQDETLKRLWHTLQNETIDYGIMENAEKVSVLPAEGLEWSDIGNWNSLFDVLIPDNDGNIVFRGNHYPIKTSGSLVYGNDDDRLIVTIGVDNLIIVDTGDILLVTRKDHAADVRQVVDKLKNSSKEKYT
ncbi:MAG: mannose-1-phosphate guanylyltransferase [Anaerolineae bacterium]|nr:mannose-1-phosphate guanylyltransferase [Anaerolineae bacterium]